KCLPATQTELRIVFRRPPWLGFHPRDARGIEPNQLVVRLDPTTGVKLIVEARRADEPGADPIHLDMEFAKEGGEAPAPYEVLLHAAMQGDSLRFTRQDGETSRPPPARTASRSPGGSWARCWSTRPESSPTRRAHGGPTRPRRW